MRWADGWLIATPEYGGSIPGMFENLMDWLTRLAPGEAPLDNFTYKVVARACVCLDGHGHGAWAETTRLLSTLGAIVLPGNDVFYAEDLSTTTGHFVTRPNFAPPKASAVASIVRSAASTPPHHRHTHRRSRPVRLLPRAMQVVR